MIVRYEYFRTQFPIPLILPKTHCIALANWLTTCGGRGNPKPRACLRNLIMIMWERLNHNPIRMLREIERARLTKAVKDKEYLNSYKRVFANFDAYMAQQDTWTHQTHPELDSTIPSPISPWSLVCTKPCRSIRADSACWRAII